MKKIFLFFLLLLLFTGCDLNDTNSSRIRPMGVSEIKNIEVTGRFAEVTVLIGTPTPCWHYYSSEHNTNRDGITTKVFAKDESEACIQVLGSFTHKELFYFNTSGEKTLRFWQNDTTYLDTIITVP